MPKHQVYIPGKKAFELRGTPVSAMVLAAWRKGKAFLHLDASGSIVLGSLRFRTLAAEEYDKLGPDDVAYVIDFKDMPPAPVASASGLGLGGLPSSAAAAVPDRLMDSTFLRIATYVPEVRTVPRDWHQRLGDFAAHLAQCNGCDIFLGPEALFCNWKGPPLERAMFPIKHQDYQVACGQIATLSAKYPGMLIMPGTFITSSPDGRSVHNIARAWLGGEPVMDYFGAAEYRKVSTGAESQSQPHLAWDKTAPRGGFEFEFRGMQVRLEICADHNSMAGYESVNLLLVTALGFGRPTMKSCDGSLCVVADGEGIGSVYAKGRVDRITRSQGVLDTFDVIVRQPHRTLTQQVSAQIVRANLVQASGLV